MKTLMSAKIHRATVTDADLNYVGSLTVDQALLDEAGLVEGEQVHVVNVNNGERFVTYVIPGPAGSGTMCANGAAARLVQRGDIIIVIAYEHVAHDEVAEFRPRIVHVDEKNQSTAPLAG